MKGYRWYIRYADYCYEPTEQTFETIFDCIDDIKESSYYKEGQANYHIGIDFCFDDDGYIQVLQQVVTPTEIFYID